jgi:hypothetical protein
MNWTVNGKWQCRSDDDQYTIVKSIVAGKPRYVPYYVTDQNAPVILSNGVFTVEAAKTICETHKKMKEKQCH